MNSGEAEEKKGSEQEWRKQKEEDGEEWTERGGHTGTGM